MPTAEAQEKLKQRVRGFWDRRPCGSTHAVAPAGTPAFFDQVERQRYELEPFIRDYADFEGARDQRVLEIGVGLGTDLVQHVRAGAHVTGVDLSPRSIELVERRLELEGRGAELIVADAERLPFADGGFDRVYSWGVLHHTPNTARAASEAVRVLRSGGRLCAMLYARRSWVAAGLWARHGLGRGRPFLSFADVLAANMESDGTKGFTSNELKAMFSSLRDLRVEKVATPYDRRVAGPLAGPTGRWLGWFAVVRGVKGDGGPQA